MRIRNYQIEILRILKANQGCVSGFNELLKKGKFHPNTLTKYLKIMKNRNLITITKTNTRTGQRRYCIVQADFEKMFNEYAKDFAPMEEQLSRKDLTPEEKNFLRGNYVRRIFYKFEGLNVATLYANHVEGNKSRSDDIDKTRARLWKMITDAIVKIPSDERSRVINSLIHIAPDLLSLEEYRNLRKPSTTRRSNTRFLA